MYAPWSCSSLPLPLTNTQIHTSLCTTSSQHIQDLLKTTCYKMKVGMRIKREREVVATRIPKHILKGYYMVKHYMITNTVNGSGQNFIALVISYWFPHFLTRLWLWLLEYEHFDYILYYFRMLFSYRATCDKNKGSATLCLIQMLLLSFLSPTYLWALWQHLCSVPVF